MIRPASDKSTGGRELARRVRQRPRAVKKWNTQNKSVSRTRKEKCQTDRPRCPERSLRGRYEALVGRFFGPFAVILEEKGGPSYHSRLTFLTRHCQKCQTSFAKALNNRKKRRLSSETASHHNTTAPLHVGTVTSPLHVGTVTRKVITSLPPAPVPLQHPYERRTSTSLNPFTRLSRHAVEISSTRATRRRVGPLSV
jgi:hypothetical protein